MNQLLEFGGFYYTPQIFKLLWMKLKDKYASEDFAYDGKVYPFKRISGNPTFPTEPNTITAIGIRNNEEISFNDELTDNDDLIVYENTSSGEVRLWRFPCTTDPKSRKVFKIAHSIKGVWDCFVVGNHRHQPGRTALRQDANSIVVARTDKNGKIVKVEKGYFGLNVHNKNGFFNSSLGCTILESDINYDQKFKPILKRVKDQKSITYIITDRVDVSAVLGLVNIDSIKPRPIEIIQPKLPESKAIFI